jgi:hypothetical protein
MLVCVEGPTGGGKSTLIGTFPLSYRRCPEVSHFIGGFPVCGPDSVDINENVVVYLHGEELASRMIRGQTGDWVQDRNWLSQITFLIALARTNRVPIKTYLEQIANAILESRIVVPDIFVYLRCPPNLTAKRRRQRGTTEWGDVPSWISKDDRTAFREHRAAAYDYVFHRLPLNVVRLDAQLDLNYQMLVEFGFDRVGGVPHNSAVYKSIRELVDYGQQ